MFSGMQEILLIVLIVLGVFFIPRMMKPRPPPEKIVLRRSALTLSWTLRLAIVLSILWPVAWALHFRPWQDGFVPFSLIGIGPVVVGWSIKWVLAGMIKRR